MVSSSADLAFAANLKALRAVTETTQARLAEKMSSRGFKWHAATVYKVENGERQIQLAEALEIARIFDTAIEDMARDSQADQLIEVREQHRTLHQMRPQLVHEAEDFYSGVHAFVCILAADEAARRLLPPDELREMVDDAKQNEALGHKLLAALGVPLPVYGVMHHVRLGEVSPDFNRAMTVLEEDVARAAEA